MSKIRSADEVAVTGSVRSVDSPDGPGPPQAVSSAAASIPAILDCIEIGSQAITMTVHLTLREHKWFAVTIKAPGAQIQYQQVEGIPLRKSFKSMSCIALLRLSITCGAGQ